MTADSRRLAIRLDAVAANVRRYRSGVAGLIARVDHDGFGHGAIPIARTCVEAGADILAVTDFDEAVLLRDAGIDAPLLALRPTGRTVAGLAVQAAVGTAHEAVQAADLGASGVHVVVDCGSAVRGIRPHDAWTFDLISARSAVVGIMGVAGAGASSDEASSALETAGALAPAAPRHLHGTRGVLDGFGAGDSYVRVGRGVYGIPLADGAPTGLPAAKLTGQVVTVKRILAGEGVSYGYIYRAPADGTIALVSCGYADGVPRSVGNHASVLISGQRARVIGRVAMDVVVVDLGGATAKTGDEVVFFGDPDLGEPSVAEWTAITGEDPAALAASIGPRVLRSYSR